ncbi:MAG: hypothetical protein LC112_01585, partial [Flavobacteriales bacterium]|nr:hypothetical protein [Flavobacteriales bacterium]
MRKDKENKKPPQNEKTFKLGQIRSFQEHEDWIFFRRFHPLSTVSFSRRASSKKDAVLIGAIKKWGLYF